MLHLLWAQSERRTALAAVSVRLPLNNFMAFSDIAHAAGFTIVPRSTDAVFM